MLAKHLIGRGDQLTECGLSAAVPSSLMTDLDDVNCRDCHKSLVRRGICPVCGEKKLEWGAHPRNKSGGVVDGRLTMNDVETIFYLACGYCSETLVPRVDPDEVAAALTAMGWLP